MKENFDEIVWNSQIVNLKDASISRLNEILKEMNEKEVCLKHELDDVLSDLT